MTAAGLLWMLAGEVATVGLYIAAILTISHIRETRARRRRIVDAFAELRQSHLAIAETLTFLSQVPAEVLTDAVVEREFSELVAGIDIDGGQP